MKRDQRVPRCCELVNDIVEQLVMFRYGREEYNEDSKARRKDLRDWLFTVRIELELDSSFGGRSSISFTRVDCA